VVLELGVRSLLVQAGQAAVAGDIGRKDGSESAFDPSGCRRVQGSEKA